MNADVNLIRFDEVATAAPGLGEAAGVIPVPPADAPPGVAPVRRTTYGTAGADGRDLDVWVYARADTTERRPGILLVHGGGWLEGSGEWYLAEAHALAAAGFVTATISYRLVREAPWPACLEDVKCAVRWLRANAGELGADPERIALYGGSAGAQLVAMAALTPGRWEGDGGNADTSSTAQAVVLMCPPLELATMVPAVAGARTQDFYGVFFGQVTDDLLKEASPLHSVAFEAPPMLVLAGGADAVSPSDQIHLFQKRLAAVGTPSEAVLWQGRGHGFTADPTDHADALARIIDFLIRRLGR